MKETSSANRGLQPYLSPLAVWALSVGSAIGWGSLVVTSRTYLSQAGPLGSILGLLIGLVMMLMVASGSVVVTAAPASPMRLSVSRRTALRQ